MGTMRRKERLSTEPTTGFISGSDPTFPPPEGSPRRHLVPVPRRKLPAGCKPEPIDLTRPFYCPRCGRQVHPDEGLIGKDCFTGVKARVCPWCFELMGVEKNDRPKVANRIGASGA